MAKYCVICKRPIENEDPAILTMGGYGVPKYICEDCEHTIDAMNESTDTEEVRASCRKLGEALTHGDTGDENVIKTVNSLIADASERAARIDDGSYIPEENAESTDEEFDITEDLKETEEDRLLDEKEAEVNKKINTITTWVSIGVIVLFLGLFLYRLLS